MLSAADEVAVHLFLQERIGFSDIHRLVSDTLDAHEPTGNGTVEAILQADEWARHHVRGLTGGA